jgi:FtsZ-binding cell division protein ZapB
MSLSSLEIKISTLESEQQSALQTMTLLTLKLQEVVNQMNELTSAVVLLNTRVDSLATECQRLSRVYGDTQ